MSNVGFYIREAAFMTDYVTVAAVAERVAPKFPDLSPARLAELVAGELAKLVELGELTERTKEDGTVNYYGNPRNPDIRRFSGTADAASRTGRSRRIRKNESPEMPVPGANESRPKLSQSDLCFFVRIRLSKGVSLEAALCELELQGVSSEVTSSFHRALNREGKLSGYGATGETWDGREVDWRYLACQNLKSHLEFVRSRLAQGATLTEAAIELAKTGVRKRVVICVCRVVHGGSISAAIDELASAMFDGADDEREARQSRLQVDPQATETGGPDCHPVRLFVGLAGLVLGGVIQFCNMSELFPTFPFAGLIVAAFGGFILSGGAKKPSH